MISGGNAEAPAAPPKFAAEMCVPVDALAVTGDGANTVAPEVGDAVSFTVEGKVSRVEGKHAYIDAEKVNGQDIPEADENPANEPDEDNLDDIKGELAKGGY